MISDILIEEGQLEWTGTHLSLSNTRGTFCGWILRVSIVIGSRWRMWWLSAGVIPKQSMRNIIYSTRPRGKIQAGGPQSGRRQGSWIIMLRLNRLHFLSRW